MMTEDFYAPRSATVSPHFSLREVERSYTAQRLGIDNRLPNAYLPIARRLANDVLEPLRMAVERPVLVSSWYRSPALNTAVGGSDRSKHLFATAADCEVRGLGNADLADIVSGLASVQKVILEFHTLGVPDSGWVHIQRAPDASVPAEDAVKVVAYRDGNGRTCYVRVPQSRTFAEVLGELRP